MELQTGGQLCRRKRHHIRAGAAIGGSSDLNGDGLLTLPANLSTKDVSILQGNGDAR
jgi:hypothetical protein